MASPKGTKANDTSLANVIFTRKIKAQIIFRVVLPYYADVLNNIRNIRQW